VYQKVVDFARNRPAKAHEALRNIERFDTVPETSKPFLKSQWDNYYVTVSDWNLKVNSMYDDIELGFGKDLASSFGSIRNPIAGSLHRKLIDTHVPLRQLYCKLEVIPNCEDIVQDAPTIREKAQRLMDSMTTIEDAFFARLKSAYRQL
jgi:hypothetical protein